MIIILSGCAETKFIDNKISCIKKEVTKDITTFDTINIELINNKIVSINLNIETELSGEKLKYKEVFIKSLEEQYNQLNDNFNIEPTIETTDKGAIVNFTVTPEQYQEMQDSETSYDNEDIILAFKKEGYTCK